MNEISNKILEWHKQIDRDLPWKQTDDPYFIWLSEIILQQTRVAQGTPYYLKFIRLFPTVQLLANASEEKVFKAWEGLGYYSRARNLHAAAKYITKDLSGKFPNTYDKILELKGVGPYTAAAIASFAFQEDQAVLDGNVFRVLSRIFDIPIDILSTEGKKTFIILAKELLPKGNSAAYNQAIMDFGALQCTPKKPNCMFCPLQEYCEAYRNGTIEERPVKKKAAKKKKRYFHILDTSALGYLMVRKREAKDVWQGLYELPLIETKSKESPTTEEWSSLINISTDFEIEKPIYSKQLLSHQEIHGYFYRILSKTSEVSKSKFISPSKSIKNGYLKASKTELYKYAFPRLFNRYFEG